MSTTQKVTDFLSNTTTNEGMNEQQYRLFDRETTGFSSYKEENGPIDRAEYFEYEVAAWDMEKVNQFAQAFNL